MNWKFWNREKKKKEALQWSGLQEEMTNLRSDVETLGSQIKKMTRIQMKSTKNTEEKIDNLESMITMQDRQQGRQQVFVEEIIRLLDEFDHVLSGIKESEHVWRDLLEQWSATLIQSLEKTGVYELEVIGETFNPEVEEAIQTVGTDTLPFPPNVPYQVVTIINRGYVSKNGKLIRKAKVVTVREDGKNE